MTSSCSRRTRREVDKTMEVAKSVMEEAPEPALKLTVPLRVDARSGDNWEAAH